MQEKVARRNEDRSREMRAALIAVGRRLFADQGFTQVGTPEIVAAAGVSRGALYHHFADKEALFAAVVEAESALIAAEIRAVEQGPAIAALIAGGEAYLAAMQKPGRVRLLLIEAPAVLGPQALAELDARHGGMTLREGLRAAIAAGELRDLPVAEMADLLSAMFERAALSLSMGGSAGKWRRVLRQVIMGLARK